jgi:hypothetical protein
MITRIDSYSYDEACAVMQDTIYKYSPISSIIQTKIPNFSDAVQSMCVLISMVIEANNPENEDEDQNYNIFDPYIIENLNLFLNYLPMWLLRYDDLDWTYFLSAFMVIFENYLNIQQDLIGYIMEDDEESLRVARQAFKELQETYNATSKLAYLTVGYADLIRASNVLVEEISQYKDARPTVYKLSKLYIDSINEAVKKKDNEKC